MARSTQQDSEPRPGGIRPSSTLARAEAQRLEEVSRQSDLRSYFKGERSADFRLPSLPVLVPGGPPGLNLSVGLHLLSAPASGGKTITALGLATWLDFLALSVRYVYAYEPLAAITLSELNPTAHSKLLKERMTWRKRGAQASDDTPASGVLIFDSLTLALRMLPEAKPMADILGDQAYPGGLKPADLAGAGLHNDYAQAYRTALFATVNSDMLPIIKSLPGAIMGIYRVVSPGVFVGVERSDREERPITVPDQFMDVASRALGYGAFRGARAVMDPTTRI
jgi:hypothetical protein